MFQLNLCCAAVSCQRVTGSGAGMANSQFPELLSLSDAMTHMLAAGVVSESVRQQILERQRRMAAAEDAPEMTLVQTAAVQRDIAAILLPGESVTKALQRLGPQKKGPAGAPMLDISLLFGFAHVHYYPS